MTLFQRKPINLNKKATDIPVVQVYNNMTVAQLASAIGRGIGMLCLNWAHVVFWFQARLKGKQPHSLSDHA